MQKTEELADRKAAPLDDPRAVNDVLALLDSTWLDETAHGRPTFYDIATSVVCNIRCPFCPRQTMTDLVQSGLLKASQFEPIAPHLETAHRTGLYGLGEPFLNKRFFEFLEEAKRRGSYCMTSTHGMSLDSAMIDRVLDSGLDELCVSIDGATRRTFNFLREGADFDTVLENVAEFLRRRNNRGQSRPLVHIACAVSKYNVWQMTAMVRLAKRLGADRLAFSNLVLDLPQHAHVSVAGRRIFEFNLNRARKLAEKLGVECTYFYQKHYAFQEPEPAPVQPGERYGCRSAWSALIVERDGNLKPCCYLDASYGNSTTGDIEEQLNSEAARALRRSFTEGKYLKNCKGCGMFTKRTAEETRQVLLDAEEQIETGNFSPPTRRMLREKLSHFQGLANRPAS